VFINFNFFNFQHLPLWKRRHQQVKIKAGIDRPLSNICRYVRLQEHLKESHIESDVIPKDGLFCLTYLDNVGVYLYLITDKGGLSI